LETVLDLIPSLRALHEPSLDWNHANDGRPITDVFLRDNLAGLLKPPGSKRWKDGHRRWCRGYYRHQFDDALERHPIPQPKVEKKAKPSGRQGRTYSHSPAPEDPTPDHTRHPQKFSSDFNKVCGSQVGVGSFSGVGCPPVVGTTENPEPISSNASVGVQGDRYNGEVDIDLDDPAGPPPADGVDVRATVAPSTDAAGAADTGDTSSADASSVAPDGDPAPPRYRGNGATPPRGYRTEPDPLGPGRTIREVL
jgi:hypothetical protein